MISKISSGSTGSQYCITRKSPESVGALRGKTAAWNGCRQICAPFHFIHYFFSLHSPHCFLSFRWIIQIAEPKPCLPARSFCSLPVHFSQPTLQPLLFVGVWRSRRSSVHPGTSGSGCGHLQDTSLSHQGFSWWGRICLAAERGQGFAGATGVVFQEVPWEGCLVQGCLCCFPQQGLRVSLSWWALPGLSLECFCLQPFLSLLSTCPRSLWRALGNKVALDVVCKVERDRSKGVNVSQSNFISFISIQMANCSCQRLSGHPWDMGASSGLGGSGSPH